ncbi:nitroreductase [Pelosinus sp. IPA-1]|uniref:Acg family FMN-binding oxidoreductase n=1 Tax=Pelosinus sp. IPA-1 TaxID=3029569 RepID=UPI002436187A|nr:nitroreductase [Pelosinus sp. IPA-1]GMA98943.1 Tat pathway signal protein [Pelosinus sp. IPA-1]
MNRRQFINYSGASLALLGGAYLFNSLLQLKTPDRENVGNQIKGLDDGLLDIIYLASLAPSGHNTQPWTVRIIDSNHWIIGIDLTRCLSVVDPENREALLSIGAFLENLVIAARVKGYDVDAEVVAKHPKDRDVVDIKLYKVNSSSNFDVKKIKLRRTVRNKILRDQLSGEDIRFLIGENTDRFIYYTRDSKEGNYLAEGTFLANKCQTYRDTAQEELAKWIRWSNHDSRQYRNGLTPETMEIDGIAKWYVKNFYSRQSVLENRFREETIKKVREQVAAGSGWLLITSKNSSIPELIDTGRKLQRLWLEVRSKRIAIHPMTQMIEEEVIGNEMASFLGISEKIQFLLRIGYCSDYPQPVSPRMLLANIIL